MASSSAILQLNFLVVPDVAPEGSVQSVLAQVSTTTSGSTNITSDEWHGLSFGVSTPELLSPDNFQKLSGMLGKLKNATDILVKIAKIIELTTSSFGSLSSIVQTLLGVVQSTVNNWIKDLSGLGIYSNTIVPPAFFQTLEGNLKLNQLSSGGFPGFVSTLGVSFYNTADKNRPVFSDDAQVGGFIILIDSDTLDEFFSTMATFSRMFSFMDILPINTNPQPPVNVRGVLKYDSKQKKYGIQLKWNMPPIYPINYRISRSLKPGGRKGKEQVDLKRLKLYPSGDEMDLFKAVKIKISTKEFPQVDTQIYDDIEGNLLGVPSFGGPKIVLANPLTGGGSFIDYNIKLGPNGKPVPLTYYYVLESGYDDESGGIWGPKSQEAPVAVYPPCINSNSAAVVENKDSRGRTRYSFISSGYGGLGNWASIRLNIPFIADFAGLFSGILKSIAGMTSNASTSFTSFINSIKDKIDYYINMVEALIGVLEALQSLKVKGRVAYLYLPVKSGGVNGFMNRLKTAAPIPEGFSGPAGITSGIVFLTGMPTWNAPGIPEEQESASQQAQQVKNQAFEKLTQLFLSIFGGIS